MAAVLLIFASVLGGFLGAYVGVLVAWWKIKDEVMGRTDPKDHVGIVTERSSAWEDEVMGRVNAMITERLLDFHDGLRERGQIGASTATMKPVRPND